MTRTALRRLHLAASLTALAIVASFLAATLAAEVVGGQAAVKHWIVRALIVLIPVMAAAALSGRRLAGRSRSPAVRRKLRRTQIAAALGLLVLVPCALVLARLDGGAAFAIVQAIELAAGATNFALLALNARDGMALSGRVRRNGVATS